MDPWRLEHSPYTPEGEIEGAGTFAAGARGSRRRGSRRRGTRLVAFVVAAAVLLPFVIQLVQLLG
jgi:hypothetical protein